MKPGVLNMKWSDTLTFTQPLCDVRPLTPIPALEAEHRQREAEAAAYERGYRDAEKSLREQLLQQRSELLELHQGVVDSLRQAVSQVVTETEDALMDLALEAAQRLVAGLPITLEMVEAVVREALNHVEDNAEITIHLHADDLALLRKHQSPLLSGSPDSGPLRFVGSTEISRGDCLVQTRFGLLDARRETKLEQLRQSLNA
jgi:flagellar assembly protein FliH